MPGHSNLSIPKPSYITTLISTLAGERTLKSFKDDIVWLSWMEKSFSLTGGMLKPCHYGSRSRHEKLRFPLLSLGKACLRTQLWYWTESDYPYHALQPTP